MLLTEVNVEIVEKLTERLKGLTEFTRCQQELLKTQRHLDEGSSERAYWHAGYASALADILSLISGTRTSVH